MAQNIEIKARANDFAAQLALASNVSDQEQVVLVQKDTFFKVPQGRLKLREFPEGPAQLIFYHRVDTEGPKLSDYHITHTDDPHGLADVLDKAYGTRHVIKKVRQLLMSGRTRLHFDTVEGLGQFIELEVVLADGDDLASGEFEAKQLMASLAIQSEDLIDVAYVDLAEQLSSP